MTQTDREATLEQYRSLPAKDLLEMLLHGSCEASTAEQALREKMKAAGMDNEMPTKNDVLGAIRHAEMTAHVYALNCEIGPEREQAFNVFENVRTAAQVQKRKL